MDCELRAVGSERRARRRARSSGAPAAPSPARRARISARLVRAARRSPRLRRCSARISAARSSSRTASSASIASCFISGATSCDENFAHANSAVKRDVARRLTSRSAKMRWRYSSGASAGAAREPVGGEGALHAGVGGDHRPAWVRLGPEVVERLLEDVRERRQERLRPAARAVAVAHGGRGTRPQIAIASNAEDDQHGPGRELGLVVARSPCSAFPRRDRGPEDRARDAPDAGLSSTESQRAKSASSPRTSTSPTTRSPGAPPCACAARRLGHDVLAKQEDVAPQEHSERHPAPGRG